MHVPMEPGYLPPRNLEPNNENYIAIKQPSLLYNVFRNSTGRLPELATKEEYERLRLSDLSHYRQFLRMQGGRRNLSMEGINIQDFAKKQRSPHLFDEERFAARYTPPPSIHKKLNSYIGSQTSTV